MSELWFYHLTRSRMEQVLPLLVERALTKDWRVAIRVGEAAMVSRVDDLLWQAAPPERFLPHGLADAADASLHPVVIGQGDVATNQPDYLIALGGAAVSPEECAALQRAVLLFDGQDQAALSAARAQWRSFAAAGVGLQYWSQESGAWQMVRKHPQP